MAGFESIFLKNIKKYKYIIILFIGVLIGSCYINFIRKGLIQSMDIYSDKYLSDYIDTSVNNITLWQYIIRTRLRDFIVLCGVGLTIFSNAALSLYIFYLGICNGLLISIAVMHYGFGGTLVYIISIFPHYIFYGVTLYLITRLFGISGYSIKNIAARNVIFIILAAMVFLITGTYFEAYINPFLIKNLYVFLY